jgi:hypothetical protein
MHRERSKMCKWTLRDERIVHTLADETRGLSLSSEEVDRCARSVVADPLDDIKFR